MARPISNYDDVIDSRDVIARLEELRKEREELVDEMKRIEDLVTETDDDTTVEGASVRELEEATQDLEDWDYENKDELDALEKLNQEGETLPDWTHGVTLVRESYFEEYTQEYAEDIGAIDNDHTWPNCHIDWEAAADELRQDFTSLDYDGITYLAR